MVQNRHRTQGWNRLRALRPRKKVEVAIAVATKEEPLTSQPRRCELLIHSGHVVDGTGSPRVRADVAVSDQRIVAVGADLDAAFNAGARIDASGLVVAPGFIDAHTHDDRAVLSTPDMTPKVSQGVTSVVTGNCGVSLAPFAEGEPPPPMNLLGDASAYRFPTMREYMDAVEDAPAAVNLAPLAGHTALRAKAMDSVYRAATTSEIAHMEALLDEALEAGCIGMSSGLAYPPAAHAPTDEIVALASRLAAHGGIYATHMRNESAGVLDAVRETLDIGERAGVPVVISHHKCSGRESWGLSRKTLAAIESARSTQRVDLDVYPYTASSTVLFADWIGAAERVLITWSTPHPECNGRDFEAVRADWGCGLEEAVERLSPAGAIYFSMHEDDLQRILRFPDAMIGSDGLPHDAHPHPRLWGTFARVLGHYSRDLGVLSLEEAVHRMTSVPARVFGLAERGVVRTGAFADLVLFDPQRIADAADFGSPMRAAIGIDRVIVNGQAVWRDGQWTGARPGRTLRRH